jgi:flagellar basal-body rod protein FlgC
MSEFDLLSVAADGMSVQRTLLDVAARNVAAAQASTAAHPYQRLVARFTSAPADERGAFDPDRELASAFESAGDGMADGDAPLSRLTGTSQAGDTADALTEMIAVLDAQRAYEMNASVFDAGKKLAERTLDVGRN